MGQRLMEIGPFSWGGNEKQMCLWSWGADSCRVRGLRLLEITRDCGYKNSLKPPRPTSPVVGAGWGRVQPRAWGAKPYTHPSPLTPLLAPEVLKGAELHGKGWLQSVCGV